MIRVRNGTVSSVEESCEDLQTLQVECEGEMSKAVSFPRLVGEAKVGDKVILNTTAVHLNLGTGGDHFVMAINGKKHDLEGTGHIMKLRYTPAQIRVQAVEEEASPYHEQMKEASRLDGMPVAVASLHSLLAPFSVKFRSCAPRKRLAYIMTDGAALPASLSRLLRQLREKQFVDVTITCGHAFGGDLEAVSIYSALQAARKVAGCDACIVAMGPGVVGTGTALGTTALEQAPLLDAAAALGARTLAIPRLSFADERLRHHGLSHHTATALGRFTYARTTVVFPEMEAEKKDVIARQARETGVAARHDVVWKDAGEVGEDLSRAEINVTTMGKTPAETPEFFAAAAAAAVIAADWCNR